MLILSCFFPRVVTPKRFNRGVQSEIQPTEIEILSGDTGARLFRQVLLGRDFLKNALSFWSAASPSDVDFRMQRLILLIDI